MYGATYIIESPFGPTAYCTKHANEMMKSGFVVRKLKLRKDEGMKEDIDQIFEDRINNFADEQWLKGVVENLGFKKAKEIYPELLTNWREQKK